MPPDHDHNYQRQSIRAAAKIHEHLLGPARLAPLPMLPGGSWQEVTKQVQRMELARSKGWLAAGKNLRLDLSYSVRRLMRELDEFHSQLPAGQQRRIVASPRDILADLQQLPLEFEEVAIDLQERTVTVVTDPIRLESLYLGPFQMVLHWDRIGGSRPYFTRAAEPHRPSHDEEVTHPHVRKDVLCEGDGSAAIKAALLEGRLLDFFALVSQILGTYNDASAYVSIHRWSGVACSDCGYSMDSEDHGICERCDEGLCSDCSTHCPTCNRYVCGGCLCECNECGERYCRSCLTDGPESTLYCETCLENEKENSDDDLLQDPAAARQAESTAVPAADPLFLGEAAVSA